MSDEHPLIIADIWTNIKLKGTLMQIWKILQYICRHIKIVSGIVTVCAICEMFVYKHTETIGDVKK